MDPDPRSAQDGELSLAPSSASAGASALRLRCRCAGGDPRSGRTAPLSLRPLLSVPFDQPHQGQARAVTRIARGIARACMSKRAEGNMAELQRIALPTGVELDVAIAGDPANPPIFLLHGFPESHRTWRHQIPELAKDHYVVAPDQRGFARSSKPEGVENYTPDKPVPRPARAGRSSRSRSNFTLVGHDWGGAIAWMAALQNPQRIAPDHRQRAASQGLPEIAVRRSRPAQGEPVYHAFRDTRIEKGLIGAGLERFFARPSPSTSMPRCSRARTRRPISTNGASPAR
jgi:hypothetical protein